MFYYQLKSPHQIKTSLRSERNRWVTTVAATLLSRRDDRRLEDARVPFEFSTVPFNGFLSNFEVEKQAIA